MRLDDWLQISTEGFAQRQADRKPEHLLKEVIQNALDATEDIAVDADGGPPTVRIFISPTSYARRDPETMTKRTAVELIVEDNGPGIENPKDLRTVFSTGKTDSFMLRGRMGQGFKEILCLCLEARIYSRQHTMHFHVDKGKRVCDVEKSGTRALKAFFPGTQVVMHMPWEKKDIPRLVEYCHRLIPPAKTRVEVNNQVVTARTVAKSIPVKIDTELFQDGRWRRREREGVIDLIAPAFPGEKPMIYEMGIPIQELDWTQDFHINVQMRVPMNPRRDAVAAGYFKDLYRQILPVLMPTLEAEELRDEWVSTAIEEAPPELRKEVVTQAFGETAVRAVPSMGRHDWNSDAREMGLEPINTALLPKGLREAAMETMRSAKDVELERREVVARSFTAAEDVTDDYPITSFVAWLASQLVDMPVDVRVADDLVVRGAPAIAAWAGGGRMSLNQKYRDEWIDPMTERFLGILVHECAHERAAHHADQFQDEVERLAGKLALYCLRYADEVRARYAKVKGDA
ncbi:MAG TPA: ATP-binding protein [Gemmatimonadales bacterium]|nr:ATP-binding protein [Gemmatimonadales bacterium]